MTHGDKAKAKSGKSSQASGKKRGTKAVKSGRGVKAKTQVQSRKATKTSSAKASSAKAGSAKRGAKIVGAKAGARPKTGKASHPKAAAGGNGKSKGRASSDDTGIDFTNSAVGAAFKRALKKYPNALRKLTE